MKKLVCFMSGAGGAGARDLPLGCDRSCIELRVLDRIFSFRAFRFRTFRRSLGVSSVACYFCLSVWIFREFFPDIYPRGSPKVQRNVPLVDLVKSFPTSPWLRNLASISPRTSPLKFAKRELDNSIIELDKN